MTFGARYLADPDLFPGRPSGEPWGDEALSIEAGGMRLVVTGLDGERAGRTRARFQDPATEPDRGAGASPDVRVLRAFASDFLPIDLTGCEYTFELDYERDAVRIAGPCWMARIDGVGTAPHASLFTSLSGDEGFVAAFENLLRVLVAYRLVGLGGALFHSAGIVDGGQAHLFLGHSGAGKSTLSARSASEGRRVLSDELNALFRRGDRLYVQQLPFAGDFGQTLPEGEPTPLAALYRLEKGSRAQVLPLSGAEATGLLLACSPFVNADPFRSEALFANLEQLGRDVPAWRFVFSLAEPAWPILRGEEVCRAAR